MVDNVISSMRLISDWWAESWSRSLCTLSFIAQRYWVLLLTSGLFGKAVKTGVEPHWCMMNYYSLLFRLFSHCHCSILWDIKWRIHLPSSWWFLCRFNFSLLVPFFFVGTTFCAFFISSSRCFSSPTSGSTSAFNGLKACFILSTT